MLVAGVDGARGGWAVATALVTDSGLSQIALAFAPDLADLGIRVDTGALVAVAIDMPIGLTGHRDAEVEARALLGPRRSSVFPTPHRGVLGASDYADARRRSVQATGKSLSVQAFNLVPRIVEVDRLLSTPRRRSCFSESHPELAFMRLAGEPLAHAKHTTEGRSLRMQLLAGQFDVDAALAERPVPIEDALDALVLLLTARHVTAGTAHHLGTTATITY